MKFLLSFFCCLVAFSAFAQRIEFERGYLKFSRFPPDPNSRDTTFEFYPLSKVTTAFNSNRQELSLFHNTGTRGKLIYSGKLRFTFLGSSRNVPYETIISARDAAAIINTIPTVIALEEGRPARETITDFTKKIYTGGKPFQFQVRQDVYTATGCIYNVWQFGANSRDSNLIHSITVTCCQTVGTIYTSPPLVASFDSIRIQQEVIQNQPALNHTVTIQRNVQKVSNPLSNPMCTRNTFELYYSSNSYSDVFDISRFSRISIAARSSHFQQIPFNVEVSMDRISWATFAGPYTIPTTDVTTFFLNDTFIPYKYIRFKTNTVGGGGPSPMTFKYISIFGSP